MGEMHSLFQTHIQQRPQDEEQEEEQVEVEDDFLFHSHHHLINPSPMGSSMDGGACLTPGYDLWCEGDIFEPIMEDWGLEVEQTSMGIPMMSSCGEEGQCEDVLREVFMECEKDILEMDSIRRGPLDGLFEEMVVPSHDWEDNNTTMAGEHVFNEAIFSKSLSFGCLDSFQWVSGGDFDSFFDSSSCLNLGDDDHAIRRSFSEGDIKTLGSDNVSVVQSPRGENQCCSSEERLQKLSRYRNKKKKRNFGRKIKYACRKALADNQPRICGRFAKTEEHHKRHKKQHVQMIAAVS